MVKREFPTGAIRDSDKDKENYIESIPWAALRRYAFYMKSKEGRYGKGNFKKGIPVNSYEESLVRHLQKYISNKYENGNFEKEEDHLSAMLFNIFGIIFEEEKLSSSESVEVSKPSRQEEFDKRQLKLGI